MWLDTKQLLKVCKRWTSVRGVKRNQTKVKSQENSWVDLVGLSDCLIQPFLPKENSFQTPSKQLWVCLKTEALRLYS